MTLGLGSGLGSRLLIINVTVWFGFNERKRLIRVFGLRSGSTSTPWLIGLRRRLAGHLFRDRWEDQG